MKKRNDILNEVENLVEQIAGFKFFQILQQHWMKEQMNLEVVISWKGKLDEEEGYLIR